MTRKISLSVIVCTKDRPDEISGCVDCLLEQTIKEFELIVVDASSDRNIEDMLARKLKKVKDRICFKYVKSPAWLTRQRNMGIEEASGEILVFLDDDVVVEKDYLENHHRVYEKDIQGRIGGVGGIFLNSDSYGFIGYLFRKLFLLDLSGEKGKVLPSGFASHLRNPTVLTESEVLDGGNTSYRRKIFDSLEFDEYFKGYGYMEDDDFSYRASKQYTLAVSPDIRLTHLASGASRSERKEIQIMQVVNHYWFFKKNMPKTVVTWFCFSWS